MILPDKYISEEDSLLSYGSIILDFLDKNPKDISTLWEDAKEGEIINSYERFIMAINFLYLIDLIDMHKNFIVKVKK